MFRRGERVAVCASGEKEKKEFFLSFSSFSLSLSLSLSLSSLFLSSHLRFPLSFFSLSTLPKPGGKDSTALAHILTLLNKRHDYGLDIFLLSVDEGISGYRDDSLATVRRNEAFYGIPLTIVSFEELFKGMTVDKAAQLLGNKSRCTLCGVLRRQALDRGAALCKADKLATGHNADDVAETLLLNLVRGDAARMARCGGGQTGGGGGEKEESEEGEEGMTTTTKTSTTSSALALPRVKPFLHTYEKEIVLYAHHKRLDYFCTECSHAKFAARGGPREAVKALEASAPAAVAGLVRTAVALSEAAARFAVASDAASASDAAAAPGAAAGRKSGNGKKSPSAPPSAPAPALSSSPGECERCGGLSSGAVCKACELLGQLERGVDEKGRALVGGGGGGGKGGAKAEAKTTTAMTMPAKKRSPVSVAFEA